MAKIPVYEKNTLEKFLRDLGSDAPAPGGGAAAGVVGAIASSLVEMVSALNVKRAKKKNLDASGSLKNISRAKKSRSEFLKLIRKDIAAFLKVSGLDSAAREKPAYQKALYECALAPLELCRLAQETLTFAKEEKPRTSAWLMSDLKEAAILCDATFRSARLNVEINLRGITDSVTITHLSAELNHLEDTVNRLKNEILDI